MTAPRGRPPIGKPLLLRLPDDLRDHIQARRRPGEKSLAATIRRLLRQALNLPDQEKRDPDDSQ